MISILSPVPEVATSGKPPCHAAGRLAGKTIGLRRDKFWISWDYVTDEWARLLEADGATTVTWRAPIGKGDKEAAESSEAYERFLSEIDVAVIGLCNCGSCTLWAVHDAVGAMERELPTVTICTEQFEGFVRLLAGQRGFPAPRMAILPYPLEGLPEAKVREIARVNYESMLGALGAVR